METQWQRALEMISTGSQDDDPDRHQSTKKNPNQHRDAVERPRKVDEAHETPVNNRQNNKLMDGAQCGDDKLQSFIDLVILQLTFFFIIGLNPLRSQ